VLLTFNKLGALSHSRSRRVYHSSPLASTEMPALLPPRGCDGDQADKAACRRSRCSVVAARPEGSCVRSQAEVLTEEGDRKELERRLAQVGRLSQEAFDALTKERLTDLPAILKSSLGNRSNAGRWRGTIRVPSAYGPAKTPLGLTD
jgi:hypothetical protein